MLALHERQKWNRQNRNLHVGDIVIVKTENEMRGSWPLARVIHCDKSDDGIVRSVQIRLQSNTLRRPSGGLVLIVPVEEQ